MYSNHTGTIDLLYLQTFLAQKYGYRPFPPKIAVDEFEAILAQVSEESDKELLTSWFRKDENTEPALYLLQPIRSKLPHYADDTDPDKKKQVNIM